MMTSPLKRKINQLNKAIEESIQAQRKATGEYGYWGLQSELDKLHEKKVQLLKEAVAELYIEYGYDSVKHRLDNLKELDDAKERLEEAERKV